MILPYKFGKYALVEKIANGGMAEIYRAQYAGERGFEKCVAIKRILPEWISNSEFEMMLIDEAKAMALLQHQNIVQIYELGRDKDTFYISMEYVDGIDLKNIISYLNKNDDKVPEKYSLFIVSEILKALEFARRQIKEDGCPLNIVHRDISPQNILISKNGEVKLSDFGIAKGLHREQSTTTNQLKGKYSYMSPEQAEGRPLDHRSDIYSLGIILYELITGTRLFSSDNDFQTIENVRLSKMPDDWEIKVGLDMRTIISRALSKDIAGRYETAGIFLNDLDMCVASKKIQTNIFEFADYLKNTGVFEYDRERKNTENRKITNILSVKKVFKKVDWIKIRLSAWLISMMIAILAFGKLGLSAGDNIKVGKGKSESMKKTAILKIESPKIIDNNKHIGNGLIKIESVPSGADGILQYDGTKVKFMTPYVLSDFIVDKNIDASLSLRKDGYDEISDNFTINEANQRYEKNYQLVSNAPAKLSINVKPWGYVTIPGIIDQKEAPVNDAVLARGRYLVKAYYVPTGRWITRHISVEAGHNYKCLADFTKNSIMCR